MNKIFKLFILIFDSHYTDVVMQNLISFFVKVLKYLAVIFCSIWVFIVVLFGIYLSVGAAIAANHGEQSIAAMCATSKLFLQTKILASKLRVKKSPQLTLLLMRLSINCY